MRSFRILPLLATALFLNQSQAQTEASARPFLFPIGGATVPTLQPLPKLDLDANRVTVSGVSSGAFMAVQLHVAHSAIFKGAASIAGGIWDCSKGDSGRSQSVCMSGPQAIVPKDHVELALERAQRGEIDDVKNLTHSRVAIFASPKDLVIKAQGSDKLEEFYGAFLPRSSITRLTNPNAAHGFPTLSFGNSCGMMGVPWILNCNDDVAGKILMAIDPVSRPSFVRGTQDPASFFYFDQTKHVSADAKMYAWGAVYVPKACRDGSSKCGLHVALHGCQMNPDYIQQQFIEHAGYGEWAETNDLVVLFPQSAKSNGNPYGCWDWFGFTGPDYTTKSGRQIKAIRNILTDLGL